jgi:hypothetical protein
MTPDAQAKYRKLPGRRRGIIRGSSVWAGDDHLLLVRSFRFREEYKRFYYRDVQAVAVANAPRFHISTRALLIAALWWIAIGVVATSRNATATGAATVGFIIPTLLWAFISWRSSCRCRIYTAVSSDELPSVYRRRTARKFLAAVDPLISGTQGALEGPWAEAADERGVGPEASRVAAARQAKAEETAPPRTILSDLLIAGLLADAALHFFPPASAILLRWLAAAFGLAVVSGAVGIMILRHKGRARAGMNKLAIASMVALGLSFYVQATAGGVIAGIAAGRSGKAATVNLTNPDVPVVRQVRGGMEALLALAGIVLSLGAREETSRGLLE